MPVKDDPRAFTWGKRKKNLYIWVGSSIGVIIILIVTGYFMFGSENPNTHSNSAVSTIDSLSGDTLPRAVDGIKVESEYSNLFPWAVMVENLYTTRPQSGLSYASVVYEALAEGGITRFLLVFATNENIGDIGPVRSARPYFVDWAKEYDGMYVHVGGSPQGLDRITELDVKDFNQFFNSGAFKLKDDKRAPHHMFTDSRLLTFGARDKEYPEQGSFVSWQFAEDPPITSRPTTPQTITVDFSSDNYEVIYEYDRTTNTYKRSQGGEVFVDAARANAQIAPKNVILQFVSISSYDQQRLNIQTTGTGNAIIFNNGEATEGTWKKETQDSRTVFYDSNGDEITLTAGQTWVEVLEKDRQNYSYSTQGT